MAPASISPERNIRTLQGAFAIGTAALLATCGGLQAAGVGPSTTFRAASRDTLSAVAGGLSRVRGRGSRESVEEYWLSAIAFFLTGTPLSAMLAVAAIFGLLMCGPSVFSNP